GDIDALIIVGAPVRVDNSLFNCAVAIRNGEILATVPKTHIPNYNEFYEKRWFDTPYKAGTSQINNTIIEHKGVKIGIEICEDLWVPQPPSGLLAQSGADIIANLSASNEVLGKHRYLTDLIRLQSARCRCGYIYASAGTGESSTDLVFAGNAIIAEDGVILKSSPRFRRGTLFVMADIDIEKLRNDRRKFNSFTDDRIYHSFNAMAITLSQGGINEERQTTSILDGAIDAAEVNIYGTDYPELLRPVNKHPFVPADKAHKDENCSEIIEIQCLGLQQRLEAIHCQKLVIGISGGLDSTLALLVAVRTFDNMGIDRRGIYGITMPGLATTNRTHNNAWQLMEQLGVTAIEIPIGSAVAQHFADIDHNPDNHDATYENSQARERTQILMDYANKVGGIVLGTGDLSELALGWATYNGDHMSMYSINASIPKTLVKHLVGWFAEGSENIRLREILTDIIDTPISPELVPAAEGDDIAQKTEELVGPYELHDFFLYNVLRNGYSPQKIYMLALKAFKDDYTPETIRKWIINFYHRFFSQQFKRSCMPDGPKVGSVCLSPRGDWRMPSDASSGMWKSKLQ
nr:NAD(+) synthase [Muribaculaceae bacterium]